MFGARCQAELHPPLKPQKYAIQAADALAQAHAAGGRAANGSRRAMMYTGSHMATTTITIRLPVTVKRRLDRLARSTARSRSFLVADAIADYLRSQEWQVQRIREGLADVQAGRVIPHEEVERWLDSWGSEHEWPKEPTSSSSPP